MHMRARFKREERPMAKRGISKGLPQLEAVELIGVCIDARGACRPSRCPAALREAGLAAAPQERATLTPDVIVSTPTRGPSGFINERALLDRVDLLYGRVRAAPAGGRFPLLYGADCAVLLGAVPARADALGAAGLVFIDGHEDATAQPTCTRIRLMPAAEAPSGLRHERPAGGWTSTWMCSTGRS
jgi:arginase family enzyme